MSEKMLKQQYDVIVIGGGTAGVPAAVAAARGGAKTLVIEQFGHLGGTCVYGIPFLGILDASGNVVNKGLMQEILDRLTAENGCFGYATGAFWNTPETPGKYQFSLTPFDPEVYKYVAQEMLVEAGADILYYTHLSDVTMEGDKIASIEVVNKSGKQQLTADVFIDCSGDADLVYKAGGRFIPKDKVQNASILFRIGGVDQARFLEDLKEGKKVQGWGSWHTRVVKPGKEARNAPSIAHMAGHFKPADDEPEITFTAVSFREGEIFLNATRSVGYSGVDAEQISAGEIHERRNVMRTFKLIKENVPAFKDAVLLYTSPLAFRETRNIEGDYVLTREDVTGATDFADGVARGAYPIDIHDPNGGRTSFQFIKDGGSYNIPYRCLLPVGRDNILVAGRCISSSHEANGTTRIMGCVVSQGQAAGTAAAIAIQKGIPPRQVDVNELRAKLVRDGAIV